MLKSVIPKIKCLFINGLSIIQCLSCELKLTDALVLNCYREILLKPNKSVIFWAFLNNLIIIINFYKYISYDYKHIWNLILNFWPWILSFLFRLFISFSEYFLIEIYCVFSHLIKIMWAFYTVTLNIRSPPVVNFKRMCNFFTLLSTCIAAKYFPVFCKNWHRRRVSRFKRVIKHISRHSHPSRHAINPTSCRRWSCLINNRTRINYKRAAVPFPVWTVFGKL